MAQKTSNDPPVRRIPGALIDTLAVAGGASLVFGVGLIYTPAGYIVAGALCILTALLMARAG